MVADGVGSESPLCTAQCRRSSRESATMESRSTMLIGDRARIARFSMAVHPPRHKARRPWCRYREAPDISTAKAGRWIGEIHCTQSHSSTPLTGQIRPRTRCAHVDPNGQFDWTSRQRITHRSRGATRTPWLERARLRFVEGRQTTARRGPLAAVSLRSQAMIGQSRHSARAT